MIANLSALADRNFVIGFLLPVILAVVALLNVFQDVAPAGLLWTAIVNTDEFAKLTLLLLAIWSLAVLLSVFNITFYRILEGYIGPLATAKKLKAAIAKRTARKTELEALRKASDGGPQKSPSWDAYLRARRQFSADFPPERLVLPTEFGNVVRACEAYSLQVYGVDCIPTWLRLISVIPEAFQTTINGARAEVDFFVNMCLLSLTLAVLSTGSLVLAPFFTHLQFDEAILRRLIAAVVGTGLSYLAYRLAILRAHAWGDIVRSAFDLYLPALAKQLGYALPNKRNNREEFWGDVNSMFLDEMPIDSEKWLPVDTKSQDDE